VAEHRCERHLVIERPPAAVFEFFASAGNLEKVTPPSVHFRFLETPPTTLAAGSTVRYRLRINLMPVTWVTRITAWDPPHRFADEQLSGPYRTWRHEHAFREIDRGRTLMSDRIDYEVPLRLLGEFARVLFVERQLRHIFDYRERALAAALVGG
jgi:ligand-binding SRPBCC domain-containing protein